MGGDQACSGKLHADAKANAVFLLRAPRGQPVGAELRGAGPVPWGGMAGMAPGSRKNLDFFSVPHLVQNRCSNSGPFLPGSPRNKG